MRVAAIQMVSGPSVADNLLQAKTLLAKAAEGCAELVLLPENFALYGSVDLVAAAVAEKDWHGPISLFLAEQAASHGFWLAGGTMPCTTGVDGGLAAPGKVYSTCTLWSPAGELSGRYDKCHLFDAKVADKIGRYQESDTCEPGSQPACIDTPVARLGMSVCYDLRFPEYFRLLRLLGADVILVPSAFTYQTGQAHWEVLLRARAIENQVFIVAANQGGQHDNGRSTWGHSCVIDPWGEIVAEQQAAGPGLIFADIDPLQAQEVRERMPVMEHRKF